MKRFFFQVILSFYLLFCIINFTFGQQATQITNQDFTVKLLVSVTDEKGRVVYGLMKENFSVFENKEQQEIVSAEIKAEHSSIVILYDGSGSMTSTTIFTDIFRLELLKFIQNNLKTSEFLIAGFSSKAILLSDWSSNNEVLVNGLDQLKSIPDLVKQQKTTKEPRTTALYDACLFALEKLESASNERKTILLITDDGGDNASKNKFEVLRKKLKESNVTIHIISLSNSSFGSGLTAQADLDDIAKTTGGNAFFLFPKEFDSVFRNSYKKEILDSFESIDAIVRNLYVLSFKPKNFANDGKWHKIEVKVNKPKGLKARIGLGYRKGYFATTK